MYFARWKHNIQLYGCQRGKNECSPISNSTIHLPANQPSRTQISTTRHKENLKQILIFIVCRMCVCVCVSSIFVPSPGIMRAPCSFVHTNNIATHSSQKSQNEHLNWRVLNSNNRSFGPACHIFERSDSRRARSFRSHSRDFPCVIVGDDDDDDYGYMFNNMRSRKPRLPTLIYKLE